MKANVRSINKGVSFFFGAGSEIAYKQPSGLKFALEVFQKKNIQEGKKLLKKEIQRVSSLDKKAIQKIKKWLPENFNNIAIQTFGNSQFDKIVMSLLENKKEVLKENLISIDKRIDPKLKSSFKNYKFTPKEYKITNNNDCNQVINSQYCMRIIHIIENEDADCIEKFKPLFKSFISLVICVYGYEFIEELNANFIQYKDNDILNDILDFGSLFRIDTTKLPFIYYALNETDALSRPLNNKVLQSVYEASFSIYRELVASCIDYQALLDEYYRYLFSPKANWAKFTRIASFLYGIWQYIKNRQDCFDITKDIGYYHDLKNDFDKLHIKAIGTSNYTNFLEKILPSSIHDSIYHLNGKLSEYIHPYSNKVSENERLEEIKIPFIFSQSGIKPMVDIEILKRYTDFYEKMLRSSLVISLGFSFNIDDSHISNIFRSYIENNASGRILILHYSQCFDDINTVKSTYLEKLRIQTANEDRVSVAIINDDRHVFLSDSETIFWTEYIEKTLGEL